MLVTNIQRFSLHDGPGIRTTVFLKGCSLRCPWCANPENLNPYPEKYIKDGKDGSYGREYTVDEVFTEVIKDRHFYNTDGGVTFSGGEPLLQAKELVSLSKKIKEVGVTTAIETCLFVPKEDLEISLPYIDFFYVDIKIMDGDRCKDKIKGNLTLYKRNLDFLCSKKKITIRIPAIGGYTDNKDNRKLVIEELKKHSGSIIKVEMLKEHNLGKLKYISLGWTEPEYIGVSDELMEQYKDEIKAAVDIPVEICKI